jgi:hypothetical protein
MIIAIFIAVTVIFLYFISLQKIITGNGSGTFDRESFNRKSFCLPDHLAKSDRVSENDNRVL